MTYVYSNDPRLKRQASTSPDAPRDPKRPATTAVQSLSPVLASNHVIPHSNGFISTPASGVAMTRKAQNAPIVDLKMQINLQTVTTMNLQLKYDHAEAQVKTAEADYQSHSVKNHFIAFPALKETKTAAVDRAKKALRAAREPLESARSELHRLIESLVDLEQSRQAPAQDSISRAEFDELKGDLERVRTDIDNVMKNLSSAGATIESCKADQKAATKALEELRHKIDNHATPVDTSKTNLPTHVDSDIARRLGRVESDLKDLEESLLGDITRTVADYVNGVLREPNDAVNKLKNELQEVVAEMRQEIKRTDGENIHLRDALTKGVDDQHTNAETLQGCLDRLDTMQALLDQAADKGTLDAVKGSIHQLSDAVMSIKTSQQKAASAPQQRTTNGVSSGLSSFQPVLGGDDQDDISPFQSRPLVPGTLRKFEDVDLTTMKMEIEGLKYKVQDQTNRYNNLQTDQLAQNMLENLSVVYPNLKEAERYAKTVQELYGRLTALETKFSHVDTRAESISNRVDVLDSSTVATRHAAEQDMVKLREDTAALSIRVDQHAKDMETGRTKFREHAVAIQEHTAAIEKAKDDLRVVETWIENRE